MGVEDTCTTCGEDADFCQCAPARPVHGAQARVLTPVVLPPEGSSAAKRVAIQQRTAPAAPRPAPPAAQLAARVEALVPRATGQIEWVRRQKLAPDQDPLLVFLRSCRTQNTRDAMRSSLNACASVLRPGSSAEDIPWENLTHARVQGIVSALLETYKPSSVNRHLSAMRGVTDTAWRLGYITQEERAKIRDVRSIRYEGLPTGRMIEQQEIVALFSYANNLQPAVRRHRVGAILALASCGLRRDEIAGLTMANWHHSDKGFALKFRGKGSKERLVPIEKPYLGYVQEWLRLRGPQNGPLITGISEDGNKVELERHISGDRVYVILTELAAAAGVKKVSAHDFRRTFISKQLDKTDIATVQRLVGHASPSTTARYDRRPEEAMRKAMRTMDDGSIPAPPEQRSKWASIANAFNDHQKMEEDFGSEEDE